MFQLASRRLGLLLLCAAAWAGPAARGEEAKLCEPAPGCKLQVSPLSDCNLVWLGQCTAGWAHGKGAYDKMGAERLLQFTTLEHGKPVPDRITVTQTGPNTLILQLQDNKVVRHANCMHGMARLTPEQMHLCASAAKEWGDKVVFSKGPMEDPAGALAAIGVQPAAAPAPGPTR